MGIFLEKFVFFFCGSEPKPFFTMKSKKNTINSGEKTGCGTGKFIAVISGAADFYKEYP